MFKFKQMRERLYFNFLPVPFCIFAYFLTARRCFSCLQNISATHVVLLGVSTPSSHAPCSPYAPGLLLTQQLC